MSTPLYKIIRKINSKDAKSLSASSMSLIDPKDAVLIINKTWKLLVTRKKEVGIEIYKKIVLKEVTLGKLFEETNLNNQSLAFMDMLSTVIGYLNDLQTLSKKLIKLGESHSLKYNVNLRHFKHFRQAFLLGIKTYIPWSEKREYAWNWFWDQIITNMGRATTDKALNTLKGSEAINKDTLVEYCVILTNSFDCVLDDPDVFANEFYKDLLKADETIATLFENTSFKQQAAKFISMLIHATRLLDNPTNLKKKLDFLGKTHFGYGVKPAQLEIFGSILTNTIKTRLGNKWDIKHRQAWTWFWQQISLTMIKSLENEVNENKNKNKSDKNDNNNKQVIPENDDEMKEKDE